jgi:hypothetical protein
MIIIGLLVLLCVSVYTVVCMWSISTCLSMEHETVFDSSQCYYGMLMGVAVPVVVIFYIFNWLSFKIFKHN